MKTLKKVGLGIGYSIVWLFVGMSYFNGVKYGFVDGLERLAIRIAVLVAWIVGVIYVGALFFPDTKIYATEVNAAVILYGAGILAIRVLVSIVMDFLLPVGCFFEGSAMPSNAVTNGLHKDQFADTNDLNEDLFAYKNCLDEDLLASDEGPGFYGSAGEAMSYGASVSINGDDGPGFYV